MTSTTRHRRPTLGRLGLPLLLIWGLTTPCTARAGLVFQATPSEAVPGSSGWFDIVLTNDSDPATGPTYQVGGFSAEVHVAANSGVTFTGATEDTTDQYIFSDNPSPPTLVSSLVDAGISVTDLSGVAPYYRNLAPGESVGLARILYLIDPSVPLTGPLAQIAVMFDAAGTTVSGADGITELPISARFDGTITAIPEVDPTTGRSALALVVGVLTLIERRRQRAAVMA